MEMSWTFLSLICSVAAGCGSQVGSSGKGEVSS